MRVTVNFMRLDGLFVNRLFSFVCEVRQVWESGCRLQPYFMLRHHTLHHLELDSLQCEQLYVTFLLPRMSRTPPDLSSTSLIFGIQHNEEQDSVPGR